METESYNSLDGTLILLALFAQKYFQRFKSFLKMSVSFDIDRVCN